MADGKSRRGFASMDPNKQREIARKGGISAHLSGRAHEFTVEEAAAAGRKGGGKRWHKDEEAGGDVAGTGG